MENVVLENDLVAMVILPHKCQIFGASVLMYNDKSVKDQENNIVNNCTVDTQK